VKLIPMTVDIQILSLNSQVVNHINQFNCLSNDDNRNEYIGLINIIKINK
jgi:hypothetical protein